MLRSTQIEPNAPEHNPSNQIINIFINSGGLLDINLNKQPVIRAFAARELRFLSSFGGSGLQRAHAWHVRPVFFTTTAFFWIFVAAPRAPQAPRLPMASSCSARVRSMVCFKAF